MARREEHDSHDNKRHSRGDQRDGQRLDADLRTLGACSERLDVVHRSYDLPRCEDGEQVSDARHDAQVRERDHVGELRRRRGRDETVTAAGDDDRGDADLADPGDDVVELVEHCSLLDEEARHGATAPRPSRLRDSA